MDSYTERDMLIQARDLYYSGDIEEAVKCYMQLAMKGNVVSQEFLGGLYLKGEKGVGINLVEANKWLTKAADSGSVKARYLLGIAAFKRGSVSDAVKLFSSAGKDGYSAGYYQLGKMYYFGSGVTRDEDKAYEWFHKAADMGHIFAKRQLSIMLLKGYRGMLYVPRGMILFITSILVGIRSAIKDPYGETTFD